MLPHSFSSSGADNNPFLRSDGSGAANESISAAAAAAAANLKLEHDMQPYWGPGGHSGSDVVYSQLPGDTTSSSFHSQAYRDFMSQGNINSPYCHQLMPAPPLLILGGEDPSPPPLRGSSYGEHHQRTQDFFTYGTGAGTAATGCERTPHRTQFQRESHILAERQRREEMNDKFSALRAMLPKSSKKDKASIVGDTINYVLELEKTVKQLQTTRAKKKGYFLPLKKKSSSAAVAAQDTTITPADHHNNHNLHQSTTRPVQVDVHPLGEQAVIKVVCGKTPKLILKLLTALEECKVDVIQSNVTTVGENAVHFFTIELVPDLSATAEELTAALQLAASSSSSSS